MRVGVFMGNANTGNSVSFSAVSVRELDAAQAPDKVTVFAGVRKLSDAALGMAAELSASLGTNNGTFGVTAPLNTSGSTFGFASKGTLFAAWSVSGASFAAPSTVALTGVGDIGADTQILRLNGAEIEGKTADQGTGTYGNYPLFIGARNGSGSFLNGHLYQLIVRGAQSTTTQITETETWVAGETGFFVPAISGVPTVGIS